MGGQNVRDGKHLYDMVLTEVTDLDNKLYLILIHWYESNDDYLLDKEGLHSYVWML